jgi:DNA mismatch repair protein MutS2
MAAETPGIINGAMLFDTQKIQPLFQLVIGRPGSSFAIDIARKIGLPEDIVKRASEKVGEETINFEKHLREIIRDKKYWEEKRGKIRKVEKTLDDLYANYSGELEDIQKERKKIMSQAKAEAQNLLKEANKRIEGTIREIKEQNADKEKTRQLREELEKFKVDINDNDLNIDAYENKISELQIAGKRLVKHSPEIKEAKVARKKVQEIEENTFEIGHYVRMKGLDSVGEIIDVNEKSVLVAPQNPPAIASSCLLDSSQHPLCLRSVQTRMAPSPDPKTKFCRTTTELDCCQAERKSHLLGNRCRETC